MRAAVLPYVQRDSTKLAGAAFYNETPADENSVYLPQGLYKIQAFIDLSQFNCRRHGGASGFRKGLWYCDPVYEAFYFRGDVNEWAGSGFCGTGFDVLPPRRGRKRLQVKRWFKPNCLHIPDTTPAHDLDGFEGRGTLVVNPLPEKAPTPIKPVTAPAPAAPTNSAPPPADAVLPPLPHHEIGSDTRATPSSATAASLHYGCTQFPGATGWSGPYWARDYDVWFYVYAEDCSVPGRLLGLRGGAANNLQWIVTVFYWNGYRPVKWYDYVNPEYSGTGGEIGCTGSVFC